VDVRQPTAIVAPGDQMEQEHESSPVRAGTKRKRPTASDTETGSHRAYLSCRATPDAPRRHPQTRGQDLHISPLDQRKYTYDGLLGAGMTLKLR
jgi:hypothetical protein